MSTDIDEWIGAEVERSFATEPPLRDPREYVARGRRARRGRQAVAASVGAAAVAIGAIAVAKSHTSRALHSLRSMLAEDRTS